MRNEAAGIKNREIKLFFHKDALNTNDDLSQASSLLHYKTNVSSDNFELVTEIDFANFLKALETPIHLIKMDIEGYEIRLINHLLDKKAISDVRAFYIETHERKIPSLTASTHESKARIKAEGWGGKFFFIWH